MRRHPFSIGSLAWSLTLAKSAYSYYCDHNFCSDSNQYCCGNNICCVYYNYYWTYYMISLFGILLLIAIGSVLYHLSCDGFAKKRKLLDLEKAKMDDWENQPLDLK